MQTATHTAAKVIDDKVAGQTFASRWLETVAAHPDLEVVDSGPRYGARGEAESIYVHDPDGLLVEFRTYEG